MFVLPSLGSSAEGPTSDVLVAQRHQLPFLLLLLFALIGAWVAGLGIMPLLFWGIWTVLFMALTISVVVLKPQQTLIIKLGTMLCCLLLSASVTTARIALTPEKPLHYFFSPSPVAFSGTVHHQGKKGTQWAIKTTTIKGQPIQATLLLTLPKSLQGLSVGDTLSGQTTLYWPNNKFQNNFDYGWYLHTYGVQGLGNIKTVAKTGSACTQWDYALLCSADAARHKIVDGFIQYLPQQQGKLLASVVLGEHASQLDEETKNAFRKAGLSHLLAASGLNVGLVAGLILLLAWYCRLSLNISLPLTMGLVAFYALMTGCPPSVMRATSMLEIALLLKLFNRQLTPLLLLMLSALVLVLFEPLILQQLGFQLSFLTTFGIMAMVPPLEKWLSFYTGQLLAGTLLVPVIAQLWVIPLQWLNFGEISLVALPANLVVLPLIALGTYLGFLLGLITLLLPAPLAFLKWLFLPAGGVITSINALSNWFAQLSFSTITTTPITPIECLILYALLGAVAFMLLQQQRLKLKTIALLSCCLYLCLWGLPGLAKQWARPELQLISVNSGQTISTLFQHHGHCSLMLTQAEASPFLMQQASILGCKTLSTVVITDENTLPPSIRLPIQQLILTTPLKTPWVAENTTVLPPEQLSTALTLANNRNTPLTLTLQNTGRHYWGKWQLGDKLCWVVNNDISSKQLPFSPSEKNCQWVMAPLAGQQIQLAYKPLNKPIERRVVSGVLKAELHPSTNTLQIMLKSN